LLHRKFIGITVPLLAVATFYIFLFLYRPAITYLSSPKIVETSFGEIFQPLAVFTVVLIFVTTILLLPLLYIFHKYNHVFLVSFTAFLFAVVIFSGFETTDEGLKEVSALILIVLFFWFMRKESPLHYLLMVFFLATGFSIHLGYKYIKIDSMLLVDNANTNNGELLQNISNHKVSLPLYELTRLSKKRNVFVILFDAMQFETVKKVFEIDPELKNKFDGFLSFSDAATDSMSTLLALSSLHSGLNYKAEKSLRENWNKNIYEGSFLNGLAKNGYTTYLFDQIGGANWNCPKDIAGCISLTEIQKILRSPYSPNGDAGAYTTDPEYDNLDAINLVDISITRALPPFLRSKIKASNTGIVGHFLGLQERVITDITLRRVLAHKRLFDVFVKKATVTEENPRAYFFHSWRTHAPWVDLDENCSVNFPLTMADSQFPPVYCALKSIVKLIDKLKIEKVYDKSLLMILSDHGAYDPVDRDTLCDTDRYFKWACVAGNAHMSLLVKSLNSRGPLKIVKSKASITDVARTICEITEECKVSAGYNLLKPIPTERVRIFNHYDLGDLDWMAWSVNGVSQFKINGPVIEKASWDTNGRLERNKK